MALNRSDKSRILRRYFPGMTGNSEMSTEPRLLPLLAIMALLLALVSLASAQEATTDTSSDPDLTADPPVAQQQNSPVKLADNTDEV